MNNQFRIYFLNFNFSENFVTNSKLVSQNKTGDILLANGINFGSNLHTSRDYKIQTEEAYSYINALIAKDASYASIINDLLNSVQTIDSDNINLQDKVLYRTPKLDLPTAKVDLLKDKYNVSVKRDVSKADYIVTSHKYIESLMDRTWSKCHNVEDLKQHLTSHKNSFGEFAWQALMDFFNTVDPNDYVKVDYNYQYNSPYDALRHKITVSRDQFEKSTYPFYIKDMAAIKMLRDPFSKIVLDSDIITLCNEDSVVLTIEDLKSIVTMIKSEDSTNTSLALEMLANCNIEKSFDKIALIFAFYMDSLKYAKNWNHVNVKSLRKAMNNVPEISHNHHIHQYNVLVDTLHKKGCLTKFAVRIIQRKLFDEVLGRVGLTRENSVFSLTAQDIKLKEEYNIVSDLPF
jgi:hypothetical protein